MVIASTPIELGLFMGSKLANYASSKPLSQRWSEIVALKQRVLTSNLDDDQQQLLFKALSGTLFTLYMISTFMQNRSHKNDITSKLEAIQKEIEGLKRKS